MAATKKTGTKAGVKKLSKGASKRKMAAATCCKPGSQSVAR